MEIRNGDTVLVRAIVSDGVPMQGDRVVVNVDGECRPVRRAAIVSVEPRPLKVGDRVTWGFGNLIGEIKAMGHGEVCLQIVSKLDGTLNSQVGALVVHPTSGLKRAETAGPSK